MAMSSALLTMAADSHESRRRSTLSALSGMHKQKQIVDIKLDNPQENCYVPSFTTLEEMKGVATVTTAVDVPFDSLHVTFQGNVKNYVEKLATSAPTNPRKSAFHTFLRLQQPLDDDSLPEDSVLKANTTYRFPFTFVVPERLLPQACTHPVRSPTIHEAHLSLPPSLGDPMMAGDGKSLLDDMTPDNVRVSYCIRVFAMKRVEGQAKPRMLFDSIKKIRIVPAVPEEPPLQVTPERDEDYVLSSSKSIKRGMFKGKAGTLTVRAVQPSPFYLHSPGSTDQCAVSAMATLNVRFEPTDAAAKPPKLGTLICRLKAATFYSATPLDSVPTRANSFQYDSNRGVYVDTIPLSSRCVESVQWSTNEPSARRDSVISRTQSLSSISDATETGRKAAPKKGQQDPKTLPFYTASVLLPIALPTNRCFVPSFHSCLISRIYLLDIVLSVNPSVSSKSFHLKVPVQIAAHGNADARPIISTEEAESIARREADGFFVPRTIMPAPGTPPVDTGRGARGSIFTARWGSIAEPDSSGGEDGREGPLPPRYTGYVRSNLMVVG